MSIATTNEEAARSGLLLSVEPLELVRHRHEYSAAADDDKRKDDSGKDDSGKDHGGSDRGDDSGKDDSRDDRDRDDDRGGDDSSAAT